MGELFEPFYAHWLFSQVPSAQSPLFLAAHPLAVPSATRSSGEIPAHEMNQEIVDYAQMPELASSHPGLRHRKALYSHLDDAGAFIFIRLYSFAAFSRALYVEQGDQSTSRQQ